MATAQGKRRAAAAEWASTLFDQKMAHQELAAALLVAVAVRKTISGPCYTLMATRRLCAAVEEDAPSREKSIRNQFRHTPTMKSPSQTNTTSYRALTYRNDVFFQQKKAT